MSQQTVSVRCYIEEYESAPGRLSARLREKHTQRRVDLGATTHDQLQRFLRFLAAARANRSGSAFYDPDDDRDCVLVSGTLSGQESTVIAFIYDDALSYTVA